MLGVVTSLLAGGLIGVAIGMWLIADHVRRSPHGCLACGRVWSHDQHDQGVHVRPIEPAASGELNLPQGDNQ